MHVDSVCKKQTRKQTPTNVACPLGHAPNLNTIPARNLLETDYSPLPFLYNEYYIKIETQSVYLYKTNLLKCICNLF